ncbi:hypothetical protein KOW79_001072 [Hemibagrus wyckioides]|uniref:Uncharacterized protein n=1 Tax=Hemibagrus wyckioides TaxID=337641 RepID=A0A9D3SYU0_9TELE|nr:hypothetical protein KOW79_001072 [Hemibagrus wyckioides]
MQNKTKNNNKWLHKSRFFQKQGFPLVLVTCEAWFRMAPFRQGPFSCQAWNGAPCRERGSTHYRGTTRHCCFRMAA